jgi:cytochrome c551/c552
MSTLSAEARELAGTALSDEARELAGRAGDYINQHGWIQRGYGQPFGAVCMRAAISYCEQDYTGVSGKLAKHLSMVLEGSPEVWNDKPGRTQADVVGVLYAVEEGWL